LKRVLETVKESTASYIDDICVYNNTWNDHIKMLDKFFNVMRHSGFTFNLKKCYFARAQIKFVGHIVGSGRHCIDSSKISVIDQMLRPTTKKELRKALGFLAHFQAYIPQYAKVAKCLSDLTRKPIPHKLPWTDGHQKAFDTLKRLLCEAVTNPLYIVDFKSAFNLSVDASGFAVACILSQTDDQGNEKPIALGSQKLTNAQSKAWSTIEKEAFAVIWALNKYRDWLFCSSTVHIYSDHNPLLFITESAPKSSKLTRWALALAEFSIAFHYKPGALNFGRDFLSRL